MNGERVFTKAEFCMELSKESFPGFTDGDTWNGFACPYFTYDEAVRLLKRFGNRWKYDETANAFIVWTIEASGDDEPEVFEGITIHFNDENAEVYPIGAYSWIWDTCE